MCLGIETGCSLAAYWNVTLERQREFLGKSLMLRSGARHDAFNASAFWSELDVARLYVERTVVPA